MAFSTKEKNLLDRLTTKHVRIQEDGVGIVDMEALKKDVEELLGTGSLSDFMQKMEDTGMFNTEDKRFLYKDELSQ
jgi:hypothetical protein